MIPVLIVLQQCNLAFARPWVRGNTVLKCCVTPPTVHSKSFMRQMRQDTTHDVWKSTITLGPFRGPAWLWMKGLIVFAVIIFFLSTVRHDFYHQWQLFYLPMSPCSSSSWNVLKLFKILHAYPEKLNLITFSGISKTF